MNSKRPLLIVLGAALIVATLFLIWQGGGDTGDSPDTPGDSQSPVSELTSPGKAKATDAIAKRSEVPAGENKADENAAQKHTGPTFVLRGVALQENGVTFTDAKVKAFAGRAHERRMSMANMFSQGEGSINNPRAVAAMRSKEGKAIAEAPIQPDGSFAFETLPAQHVRLMIDHHFYALAQPEIVHLEAERATHITLRPRLGGHLIGRVAGDGPHAGKIRLTAEVDIMGMMRRPEDFMGNMINAFSNSTEVEESGRFEFRAVAPSSNIQLLFQSEDLASRFGPTTIQAGQTREVVIHPIACGRLLAIVKGPGGEPVAEARIRLQPQDVTGQQSRAFSTKGGATDSAGRGEISGLLPGRYDIGISASGYVGVDREIDITGEREARIEVKLTTGGIVKGTVVDEQGVPIADAGVSYLRAMKVPLLGDVAEITGEDLIARSARASGTRTDAEGRFVLGGIDDEDKFSVIAWHQEFGGGRAKDVSIGDENVSIQLRHPARVTGKVVDDATGEPVREFAVSTLVRMAMVMERATSTMRIENSEDGSFALERVRSGKSKLSIQAGGYADYATSIELVPGKPLDVGELRLKKASAVRGVVLDHEGRPVVGATVGRKATGMLDNAILRSMSGESSCTSDEHGRFELKGLRDGAIKLKATAPGHASGISKRIKLAPGQTVEGIELKLSAGGTVHGELLLPEGMTTDGWLITLSNNQGGSMLSSYVDPDGTFKIHNVDPGRYDVQGMNERTMLELSSGQMRMLRPGQQQDIGKLIAMAQRQIVRTKARVKVDEITEVVLDASDRGEDGCEVTLRVTLGDRPMTNGWMEIERLDTGDFTQGFIEGGVAKLPSIQPGSVRVRVRTGITMTPVGEPVTLEIPDAKTHSATVRLPGGGIRGIVVDEETGEPLGQAIVRIVAAAGSVNEQVEEIGFETTDDQGEFAFDGLRDGRYSLFANDSFFNRGARKTSGRLEGIEIVSGRSKRKITLRTRRASRATALVENASGRPVKHALVFAVDKDGQPLSLLPARTDDAGQATVMGLPTGKIRLVVMAPGLVPGFSNIQELLPARETAFRMALDTGSRVRVRVEDGSGQAPTGAQLSARWNNGPWIPLSLVQRFDPRTRQVDLGHLAAGRVEFRVHHPTKTPFTVIREIPRGTAVELVFTAPR